MSSTHPGDFSITNFSYLTDSDAVDKIDAEIASLQTRIHFLRSLRNSLVPVSRLPAEVLSKVFLICQGATGYRSNDLRLPISWTSRHWRSVALGYPALWSEIMISHPSPPAMIEYVQACFLRSKQTPLLVWYYGPSSQVLALCASQMHRIRDLSVDNSHRSIGPSIAPLSDHWQTPAPLLLNLNLEEIRLEDGMFGSVDPPLRVADLSSCDLSKCSRIPGFSTLTVLRIYQPAQFISPGSLVSKLQAMSALRSCILEYCFSPRWQESSTIVTDYQARLPSLEYLSVADFNMDLVEEFLSWVEMPHASPEVISLSSEVSNAEFQEEFQWFANYQGRVWKDIYRLDIVHGTRYGRTAVDALTVIVHSTPDRSFTFSVEQDSVKFNFDPVVSASTSGCLPLETVRELYVDTDYLFVDKLNSLGHLPRVETLELEYVTADFLGWAKTTSKEVFPFVKELKVGKVSYQGFEGFIEEKLKVQDDGGENSTPCE